MATTVLHRVRGGEVLKISLRGQLFDDRDTVFWGVLIDPPRPDGDTVRDLSGATPGPMRALGFAKVFDGTDVRNADQAEIDQMPIDEDEDEKDQDAAAAIVLAEVHPQFRKVVKALALITMDEINLLRAQHSLTARTKPQVLTALMNKISRDD